MKEIVDSEKLRTLLVVHISELEHIDKLHAFGKHKEARQYVKNKLNKYNQFLKTLDLPQKPQLNSKLTKSGEVKDNG